MLVGSTQAEVRAYLPRASEALGIRRISEYTNAGNERIIVELGGTSVIGGLASILLPANRIGSFSISSLICLSVKDGKVVNVMLID